MPRLGSRQAHAAGQDNRKPICVNSCALLLIAHRTHTERGLVGSAY